MFSIYCIRNKKTDKRYIGMSKCVEDRWKKHISNGNTGKGNCTKLIQAFQKHGIDQFEFDVLEEGIETREEAWEAEKRYVSLYNSFKNGYNGNEGGSGGYTADSENFKKSMKIYHESKPKEEYATMGFKGKKHSEESKQLMAEARKKRWQNMSDEDRENLRKKQTGKNNSMYGKVNSQAVKVEYNGKIYDSLTKASKACGVSVGTISKYGKRIGETT